MRDVWNVFCYDRMCSLGKEEVSRIVGQKEREFVGERLCVTVGCWTAGKGHRQTQTETQA